MTLPTNPLQLWSGSSIISLMSLYNFFVWLVFPLGFGFAISLMLFTEAIRKLLTLLYSVGVINNIFVWFISLLLFSYIVGIISVLMLQLFFKYFIKSTKTRTVILLGLLILAWIILSPGSRHLVSY